MSVTANHVFAKWKVRPGQLENVLLILKELKAKSIQEEGNLFYQVHQDSSDPNTLILFEGYSDVGRGHGGRVYTKHKENWYSGPTTYRLAACGTTRADFAW